MPRPVNPLDVPNFLRNGYVSRTLASRDGAGNIKLSANVSSTQNSTITIESVTSQFSTETALKLFETRFEYFKFPVQTVAASSLANVGATLDQEVKDALAGVSFEQDVITRRLELIPSKPGTSRDWFVPLNWGDYQVEQYLGRPHLYKGRSPIASNPMNINVTNNFYDSLKKDPDQHVMTFANNVNQGGTPIIKVVNAGPRVIPLTNGNSPGRAGFFRITPEMIKQLEAGGKIYGTTCWKRNLKIRVKIKWSADDSVKNMFEGTNVHFGARSGGGGRAYSVPIQNGPMLMVQLESDLDEMWGLGMLPRFIQSLSDYPIGVPKELIGKDGRVKHAPGKSSTGKQVWPFESGLTGTNQIQSAPHDANDLYQYDEATLTAVNPIKYYYSTTMEFEYIIDTRDLVRIPDGKDKKVGEYREYALNVMSNYKSIIHEATFDVSVEELPTDIASDTAYDINSARPKTTVYSKFTPTSPEYKYNRYRSLFAFNRDLREKIGGVRTVIGPNILCGTYFGDDRVIGYTHGGKNGAWYNLMIWDNSRWNWGPKYNWTDSLATYTGETAWSNDWFDTGAPYSSEITTGIPYQQVTDNNFFKFVYQLDKPFVFKRKQ